MEGKVMDNFNDRINSVNSRIDNLSELVIKHIESYSTSLGKSDANNDIHNIKNELLKREVNTVDNKINRIINVMIFLLLYQIFIIAYPNISEYGGVLFSGWGGFSEGWKIAIFMLIMSIPVGIITMVLGHLLIKKYIK